MKKIILLMVASIFMFSGCSDKDGVKSFLERQGYKYVTTESGNIFSCGKNDVYATKFYAKNPNGFDVTGVVCEGVLKGKTIRFY